MTMLIGVLLTIEVWIETQLFRKIIVLKSLDFRDLYTDIYVAHNYLRNVYLWNYRGNLEDCLKRQYKYIIYSTGYLHVRKQIHTLEKLEHYMRAMVMIIIKNPLQIIYRDFLMGSADVWYFRTR
jgi:hypothetical protein